jgi:hypothetical protein
MVVGVIVLVMDERACTEGEMLAVLYLESYDSVMERFLGRLVCLFHFI